MSWVSIDREACTGCGICAVRCVRCFSNRDGEISVDAHEENCNLCGHCIALCPVDAVTHEKMDMSNFVKYETRVDLDTEAFVQFLRERRSHRIFQDKVIPRKDLETLVDVCRYAPTGSNVQNVELIVVQDQGRIQAYSDLTVDYFLSLTEPARRRVEKLEAEGKQDTDEYLFAKRTAERGPMFELARNSGLDPILYKAPAVMIFHSPAITSAPKDNGVIASTSAALTARTMGLEACYIGLMEAAANAYPPLFHALDLPEDHKVFSVIILGYPKLKFLRAVDRKPIKVRWE